MKIDKLSQKIDELEYMIRLDDIGLKKAEYNLDYAEKLHLTDIQIKDYKEKYDYYSSKMNKHKNTYSVYMDCLKSSMEDIDLGGDNYLFNCTFPYQSIPNTSCEYQTKITVGEKAVKLFANGIDYNEALSFLDNSDIKSIDSTFKVVRGGQNVSSSNVTVELCDLPCESSVTDEPILAKVSGTQDYKGLIASSKISCCYPYGKAKFIDLNGENYLPEIPSFDSIKEAKRQVEQKQEAYNKLNGIEKQVKIKLEDSIRAIDAELQKHDGKYENFLKF